MILRILKYSIAITSGVLAVNAYNKFIVGVKDTEELEQTPAILVPEVEPNDIQEEIKEKPVVLTQREKDIARLGKNFYDIFFENNPHFFISEITDYEEISVSSYRGDHIILIVPPIDDPSLFTQFYSQIKAAVINYKQREKESGNQLQIQFLKLTKLEQLKKLAEKFDTDLPSNQDVPIFITKNRFDDYFESVNFKTSIQETKTLQKFFKPLKTINKTNLDLFKKTVELLEKDTFLVLFYYNPEKSGYKEAYSKFYKMANRGMFSKMRDGIPYFFYDKSIFEQFKLNSGDFLLIQRTSHDSNYTIGDQKVKIAKFGAGDKVDFSEKEILKNLGEMYYKHNLFANYDLPMEPVDFVLELAIDMNKCDEWILGNIKDLLSKVKKAFNGAEDLKKEVVFHLFPRDFSETENNLFTLTIKDTRNYRERQKYSFGINKREEMLQVLHNHPELAEIHSYQYTVPVDYLYNEQKMMELVRTIREGKGKENFKSQKLPPYKRTSRKIVGSEFNEKIMNSVLSHGVLYYTKHCGGCKRFSPVYEKLAKMNLKSGNLLFGKQVIMNRINTDYNKTKGAPNFFSTPVFSMYRAGFKCAPYIYKYNVLNENLLKDFYSISLTYNVIQKSVASRLWKKLKGTDNFKISL